MDKRDCPNPLAATMLVLSAVLVLSGCSGVGDFTFTERSRPQTIDSCGVAGSLVNVIGFNFNINLHEELEARNADGAKAVYLKDVDIVATDSSPGQNLGFLESVVIDADSPNNSPAEVAWNRSISDGQSSVDLDTDDNVNLKPYIQDGLEMNSDVEGSCPSERTTLRGVVKLEVVVL